MAKRDAEILRQERELHKLRVSSKNLVIREKDISSLLFLYIFSQSVLQQANTIMSTGEDHLLTTIQEDYSMAGAVASSANKKQGVSGKSVDPGQSVKLPKVLEKDFRSRQLIREALQENDFLKNLGPGQVREVVDYMELKRVPAGTYVIREGDSGEGNIQEKFHMTSISEIKHFFCFSGSHLYVSAEGEYEVIKEGKVLGRLGGGKAFGELAILYNCMRTASIKGKLTSQQNICT